MNNIENRKARYNYYIEDTLECGIELFGNEVKSINAGMCQINESWASVDNGELFIYGINIAPWETTNRFDIKKNRPVKLLAHKQEIRKLASLQNVTGMTLIPLKIYETKGKIKVQLGICKGKHNWDKRESIKERDVKRDIQRKYNL